MTLENRHMDGEETNIKLIDNGVSTMESKPLRSGGMGLANLQADAPTAHTNNAIDGLRGNGLDAADSVANKADVAGEPTDAKNAAIDDANSHGQRATAGNAASVAASAANVAPGNDAKEMPQVADDTGTGVSLGSSDVTRDASNTEKRATTRDNQLGQLMMGILDQLNSGKEVKMIVDIKNPEVMMGNNHKDDAADITAVEEAVEPAAAAKDASLAVQPAAAAGDTSPAF